MIPLEMVDLTGLTIGQTAPLDLTPVGQGAGGVSASPAFTNQPAMLYLFNESGAGLYGQFQPGQQGFNLPAGAWRPIPVPLGQTGILFTVLYTIANPSVSKLLADYYSPGEPLPTIQLGNSPVGGSISSGLQTLSNENNARSILVIDIGDGGAAGPAGITNLINLFTDHFFFKVDQNGTAHTVLQGQTAGNPLQIGQTGDIAEVLSVLQTDDVIKNQVTGVQINGGTSGTATLYQDFSGNIKRVRIRLANYQSGAGAETIVLPTAFSEGAQIWVGGMGTSAQNAGLSLLSGSGVAQVLAIVTTLSATGGSNAAGNPTTMYQYSWAECNSPFAKIQFQASGTAPHSAEIHIMGR